MTALLAHIAAGRVPNERLSSGGASEATLPAATRARLWFNDSMAETGTDARPPLLQPDSALFLDFDGTLAEFAQHPDGVTIDAGLPALLADLRERLGGAVALVTGRTLAGLDAVTGLPPRAAAGLHGLELRFESGRTVSAGIPDGASHIARQLREQFRADPRLVIEDKGAGVALHWRLAPERSQECIAAMTEVAASPEFEILRGHAVIEARPRGTNKGAALAALSKHGSFAGRRPVFVGDDVTDEDGFRSAALLGGFGVKVGPGETAARYRMSDVGEVHAWLASSLAALTDGATS
jgi:trehalose 6-phosphate phosphatase